MEARERIKNIPFSTSLELVKLVAYRPGRVVNRRILNSDRLSITLYAFGRGDGFDTYAASGDSMVQVLDGDVFFNIGGKEITCGPGQMVAIPADIPHTLTAIKRSKVLLTVVR
jgi:quercetin dioxygenase-like cupin family protein